MKIGSVRKLITGLCAMSMMLAATTGLPDSVTAADPPLTGEIQYRFVGHLRQTDDAGRLLVWEANVSGDFNGTMKWWFEQPPPVSGSTYAGGRVTFYAARWEIWADGSLLLAGESAGKTVFPDGSDGMWDGHGVVTEAAAEMAALRGRRVYETGPVILGSDPPASFTGTGMFRVF